MKVKLRKQFLSTDYEMQLYERFNSHYVLFNEMNYLSKKKKNWKIQLIETKRDVRGGIHFRVQQPLYSSWFKWDKQADDIWLSCWLTDELGVVHLFNLEDTRQYALIAKKQVLRYSARRLLSGKVEGATQRGSTIVQSVHNDQTAQNIGQDTSIMNRTADRNTTNIVRSEKGKGSMK
jgi:hypothetical protein